MNTYLIYDTYESHIFFRNIIGRYLSKLVKDIKRLYKNKSKNVYQEIKLLTSSVCNGYDPSCSHQFEKVLFSDMQMKIYLKCIYDNYTQHCRKGTIKSSSIQRTLLLLPGSVDDHIELIGALGDFVRYQDVSTNFPRIDEFKGISFEEITDGQSSNVFLQAVVDKLLTSASVHYVVRDRNSSPDYNNFSTFYRNKMRKEPGFCSRDTNPRCTLLRVC